MNLAAWRIGALFALAMLVPTFSRAQAPLADALGPEVPTAKVVGGFVGKLSVSPDHGPAGTPVHVVADGLPPNQDFALVWRTVKGAWKIEGAQGEEYHGREFQPVAYQIAQVGSDSSGHVTATFVTPDDFGFEHDIVLQQGQRLFIQTAYSVDMTIKLSPESGPVGTPIKVDVHGIGWRELESSWVLLY
ncbi:MAG TPA: hypothetical protein VG271_20200, partial [Beijerinckiaceae bacterium]|nr:hypothetical protein [Beijerinckiaceae bacterium]